MHLVLFYTSNTALPPPLYPLVGQDKLGDLVSAGGPLAGLKRRLHAHLRL